MCGNLEAVQDAWTVGEDVERSVCGGVGDGPACPVRSTCSYQAQKQAVRDADVVIASNQTPFHSLASYVRDNLALLVADESWWQSGLVKDRPIRLASLVSDVLRHAVRKSAGGKQVADNDTTGELRELVQRLAAVLDAMEDGAFLSREAVVAAGLSADNCARAHKLEWARKVDDVLVPGMST